MKFLRKFNEHTSYEAEVNVGGDFKIPNVSYCKDVKDVHFNPYNLIKFYVGEVTEPQTVSIYTDKTNHVDVTVSKGYKWYSYLLPKDKELYAIKGNNSDAFSDDIITKVIVNANISYSSSGTFTPIIPSSIIEAYFKCSNTSNITDMSSMFNFCSGLTSLDLRNFNTSNVTSMNSMFFDCKGLTFLDLSRFNTIKVTNMASMFSGCKGLKSLDLSSFDTSKVTDMYQMFYRCSNLTSLDLRNFNTSNVDNMGYMFNDCTSLTSLDLSGWNTSNVTDMYSMFKGCTSLTSIRMVGCEKPTIDKIKAQLTKDNITGVTIVTE